MEKLPLIRDFKADCTVAVSARTGQGLEEFLSLVEGILRAQEICIEEIFPYQDGGKIQLIRKYGEILEEEYKEEGILIKAYLPAQLYERVRPS